MMSFIQDLKSVVTVTRARLTLDSVETYFLLMSIFATLGMIFDIFASAGSTLRYGNTLDLNEIFGLLGSIFLAIMLGLLIYLTAMLSIYFDDVYKLSGNGVLSSNFVLTRLFTPVARGLILLVSLILFLFSINLFTV